MDTPSTSRNQPRSFTPAEAQQVIDEINAFYGCDHDTSAIEYSAVFDRFISDSPGYAGGVAVIVWSGGPCYQTTLLRDEITGRWWVYSASHSSGINFFEQP